MKAFRILAEADIPQVFVYGDIGGGWYEGVTAKEVADELKAVRGAETLEVRINSMGGDVFTGIAIYNQLQQHGGTIDVHVDGIAASAASIVAMAGDEITMHEASQMMVHNPWMFNAGDAAEFRKAADILEQTAEEMVGIYTGRTGLDADAVRSVMAAETWYTAELAVEAGFATSTGAPLQVAACWGPWVSEVFSRVPEMPESAEPNSSGSADRYRLAAQLARKRAE